MNIYIRWLRRGNRCALGDKIQGFCQELGKRDGLNGCKTGRMDQFWKRLYLSQLIRNMARRTARTDILQILGLAFDI